MNLLTTTLISLVAGQILFINEAINNANKDDFLTVSPFTKETGFNAKTGQKEITDCKTGAFFLSGKPIGKQVYVGLYFERDLKSLVSEKTILSYYTTELLSIPEARYDGIHFMKTSTEGYSELTKNILEIDNNAIDARITLSYSTGKDFKACVREALYKFDKVFVAFNASNRIPDANFINADQGFKEYLYFVVPNGKAEDKVPDWARVYKFLSKK